MLKLRRYPYAVCVPADGPALRPPSTLFRLGRRERLAVTRLALATPSRPVDAGSLDRLGCGADDLEAVSRTLEWARTFLGTPHADLGRRGPVCPYIQHSFDERLLYVSCRPEAECASDDLIAAVRTSMQQFTELQQMAPTSKRHLVSILIVLPHIDRASSDDLNALQRELKDEFVSNGLMIGQFHPKVRSARTLEWRVPPPSVADPASGHPGDGSLGPPVSGREHAARVEVLRALCGIDPGPHPSLSGGSTGRCSR